MIERVAAVLGRDVRRLLPQPGGDICQAARAELDDGQRAFVKWRTGADAGFFAAEAWSLRWLADAGAPVPEVLAVADDLLVLGWIEEGRPTAATGEQAGRAIAALHAAGAPTFGHPEGRDTWIGSMVLPGGPALSWPELWAEHRVRPLVRELVDAGRLDGAGAAVLDDLCDRLPAVAGPPEPPARLHGDLWSGNLLTDEHGRPWLVDPAAHGGHRETDLAMLALFGGLRTEVLGAYQEVAPLADGWTDRQPLHQLHPLLVHACLFGGGYARRAVDVARHYVGTTG
jgi:fructosamine-3-kinase